MGRLDAVASSIVMVAGRVAVVVGCGGCGGCGGSRSRARRRNDKIAARGAKA